MSDLPERRWAMTRLRAGDWLCWSNDRETLWRFHQHIDGAALGLCDSEGNPVPYEERTYWRAVYLGRAHALAPDIADSDPWESPWIEDDWYLPTRQACIDRMLRAGVVASTP